MAKKKDHSWAMSTLDDLKAYFTSTAKSEPKARKGRTKAKKAKKAKTKKSKKR